MTNKTAHLVKKLDGFTGDARLYQLSEPVAYHSVDHVDGDAPRKTKYIVVSGTTFAPLGPETFIFPAREDGEILDWLELEGSFQGSIDHEKALSNAGYRMVTHD